MTSKVNKEILKEVKNVNFKSFAEEQITVLFPDENDLTQVDVKLTPNNGIYKGGCFVFRIFLTPNYPYGTPTIVCQTNIFHPNIYYDGDICFNILQDEWSDTLRIQDYAHALLWLLYQPNLDSRLNGDCPDNMEEFKQMARAAMHGQTVAGHTFTPALAEGVTPDYPLPSPTPAPAQSPPSPPPPPAIIPQPVMPRLVRRVLPRPELIDDDTSLVPPPPYAPSRDPNFRVRRWPAVAATVRFVGNSSRTYQRMIQTPAQA